MSQQHHLDKLDDLSGSNAELKALTPNLPKEDVMKKEISEALMDFYKQVLAPEFVDIKKVQSGHSEKFIDVLGHFDSVYKRFDRLEDEYHAVTHGLKRIEDQLGWNILTGADRDRIIETVCAFKAPSDHPPPMAMAMQQHIA